MCIPALVSNHLAVFVLISIIVGFLSAVVATYLWGLFGLLSVAVVVFILMIAIAVDPGLVQYCGTGA
jgi:hypothetical protein